AALMVMDILVPVSPSGTGNTFSSFSACLFISMAAAALIIILRKSAPLMICFNSFPSEFLTDHHRIDIHVHGTDFRSRALGNHITELGKYGGAHGAGVGVVVDDGVQINGNGIVLVEVNPDALSHGFLAQQVVNTIGNTAGSHALDTEAVGRGGTNDVGINI